MPRGQLYTESLALADKAGDRLTVARSLEGLAGLLAADKPERAVRLAGAADRVRGVLGAAAHPAERRQLETWLSAAHQALGGAAFSAAWTAVQALGLAEAVQASAAAESNGPLRPAAPEPSARSMDFGV